MSANTATAGQRITAAWLNTNIPGPWIAITPLNSWANGTPAFQARQRDSVTLEVIGTLTGGTSGNTGNGTEIGQLPSSLPLPSNTGVFPGMVLLPAADTDDLFQVNLSPTTGHITIYGCNSAATSIGFHAFFSLDA